MSGKERQGPEAEPDPERDDSPFFAGLGRDEPPGKDPDRTEALPVAPRPCAEASLDSQASKYFALLDASLGGLQERAQEVINVLNSSRKEDHSLMRSFRESLLLKVSGLAEQLEERVFHLYDLHNKLIQERLQELEEVMERVGQAKTELQQVCLTVEAAYRDLCLQPET
ncbi:synaptonemal complex central element protein 2 [Athene noctua]|uniref:synaptonemal complex central element protein 2 n=1 Tax=Athene noctua TaxID=126797 RepID=UPI003EBC2741